jgi:hypothetical protein
VRIDFKKFVKYMSKCKFHIKFYIKKFVKYLSKCKFYKTYGNTADSTEKNGGVLCISIQKDHSPHFTSYANEILYARKVDFCDKLKEEKNSQFFPYVNSKVKPCKFRLSSDLEPLHTRTILKVLFVL